jgi:ArsR family transcriptional regulator
MTDSTAAGELPDSLSRLYDDPETEAATLRERAGDPGTAESLACLFAALSNPQRLRLLWALRDGECCVCELQTALDAPQSTVATHLRCLTEAGLVTTRKEGKWSYYRAADPTVFDLIERATSIEDAPEATE